MLDLERERVAAASRRLAREGLVHGTSGNVWRYDAGGVVHAHAPVSVALGCVLHDVQAELTRRNYGALQEAGRSWSSGRRGPTEVLAEI